MIFIARIFVFPATVTIPDETFDVIYYPWPVIITVEDFIRFCFTWVFCSVRDLVRDDKQSVFRRLFANIYVLGRYTRRTTKS